MFKKIRVTPKIRALPSGTWPQTLHLENFATWCNQQISSTVAPVDYTYDGRAGRDLMHNVFTRWCNCQLHCFELFWICCTTYLAHPVFLYIFFCDFCQDNYLNIHQTDFYETCRHGRSLAVNERSKVIFSISQGTLPCNHFLLIVSTQFFSSRQISETA